MRKIISIILTGCLLVGLSACSNVQSDEEQAPSSREFFAMNTYISLTAYGNQAENALAQAQKRIEELENLWSVTEENSDIFAVNHSGGQTVSVSEETAELISFALEMAEKTEGALDPTIYPVLTAWGFTTDSKQVPSAKRITELLQNVGYRRIQLEGSSLTVPEGMELDLGAVGKGYTADLVTEVLREYGVESAIISLGGNIQAVGSRPDGSEWRIGIRAPWEDENLGVLEVSDAAVVTSGGYENYFEDEEGTIYWHIIDPETGYPAHSGLQAVTIIGDEGRMADALSTALFVMGTEQAEEYWREYGGFDMLLITDENEIVLTEGIADKFTLGDGRSEIVRVLEE